MFNAAIVCRGAAGRAADCGAKRSVLAALPVPLCPCFPPSFGIFFVSRETPVRSEVTVNAGRAGKAVDTCAGWLTSALCLMQLPQCLRSWLQPVSSVPPTSPRHSMCSALGLNTVLSVSLHGGSAGGKARGRMTHSSMLCFPHYPSLRLLILIFVTFSIETHRAGQVEMPCVHDSTVCCMQHTATAGDTLAARGFPRHAFSLSRPPRPGPVPRSHPSVVLLAVCCSAGKSAPGAAAEQGRATAAGTPSKEGCHHHTHQQSRGCLLYTSPSPRD